MLKLGLSCVAARSLELSTAAAQSKFPERPIKLIIAFGPGGIADVIGRMWADKVKGLLGPMFIENQAGAGGSIGRAMVVRARPDGYTMLAGGVAQILIPLAATHGPHDPFKDLEPICILIVAALAIAIHPSVPARNLEDLIAYAKSAPASLSYGSAGPGTMAHLAGELFKTLAKCPDIIHVPYKGGGQSIIDLVSGHIPMVVTNVTNQVVELHQAGKIRMLAVTSPARLMASADVPTAAEAGLLDMIAQNFIGLFVPAGTPQAIIARIADGTRIAMADEEFQQKLVTSGFEPYPTSAPEAARRFIEDETARWTPVINAAGIRYE